MDAHLANMEMRSHWNGVYKAKKSTEASWYQAHPEKSLSLIKVSGISAEAAIIDIGGGASTLADHLLELKYRNLWVLDISGEALIKATSRIGRNSEAVRWIEADITKAVLPHNHFYLWHDRAVFHFLIAPEDR